MLGFAAREIQLNTRESDGATLRDHVKQLQRSSGPNYWPEGLAPVACRPEVEYLWDYFSNMHVRRKAGEALRYSDIKAWAEMRGVRLERFELDALDALEVIYLHYSAKRAERAAAEAADKVRRDHGRRH